MPTKTRKPLLSLDSDKYKKRLTLTLNLRIDGFYSKTKAVTLKCHGARIRNGFMEIKTVLPVAVDMRNSNKPQRWILAPAGATFEDGSGAEIVASRQEKPTSCDT